MVGLIHNNLPIFDDKDYDDKCVKIEAILGFQKVDEVVKTGLQEPLKDDSEVVKKKYKENWLLDCKARMLLHYCISPAMF